MNPRWHRAAPKMGATVVLVAAVGAALFLTGRQEEEDVHSAHSHHVGTLRAEGIRLQQQGDLAGAMGKYREAAALAEKHGLLPALASNRIAMATVHLTEERYPEAARDLRQALEAARRTGNRMQAAAALAYLGQALRLQGQDADARAALREALELAGTTPGRARATAHYQMGEIHRARGDHAGALAAYREAHAALRELDDRAGQAAILISIGRTEAALGDPAAPATLAAARDLLRRLGLADRAAQVESEIAALAARR